MPPLPKPENLRQRRNKSPSRATLQSAEVSASNEVPPLPERKEGWHPMVVAWWDSAWRSPMASEWLESDMRGGLYLVAMLHQDFWDAETRGERASAAAEIRLQEVRFGLSPIDRRRLQWTVEQGEAAAERTAGRRTMKAAKAVAGKDPRTLMKAVS